GCKLPLGLAADQKGILPDRMIAALTKAGAILPAYEFAPDQIQPASLDLRLGDIAYRVRASFLPGRATVAERIEHLKLHEIALGDGAGVGSAARRRRLRPEPPACGAACPRAARPPAGAAPPPAPPREWSVAGAGEVMPGRSGGSRGGGAAAVYLPNRHSTRIHASRRQ